MAFILTSASWASMLELWSTKKLAAESDVIQVGEVTSQWSSWDPETRLIYTYTKLKVKETVKGQTQDEVLIKQPGGEVGGIGMKVHGMATFSQGEKALVFLKKSDSGTPSVVGMAQGKYKIVKDRKTGEDKAQFIAPSDVEFYQASKMGLQQHVGAALVNREINLKSLIREIKEAR